MKLASRISLSMKVHTSLASRISRRMKVRTSLAYKLRFLIIRVRVSLFKLQVHVRQSTLGPLADAFKAQLRHWCCQWMTSATRVACLCLESVKRQSGESRRHRLLRWLGRRCIRYLPLKLVYYFIITHSITLELLAWWAAICISPVSITFMPPTSPNCSQR